MEQVESFTKGVLKKKNKERMNESTGIISSTFRIQTGWTVTNHNNIVWGT